MIRRVLPLLIGAVPFVMLVFALPFVNRIDPIILGLPFVVFWIMLGIALCPPLLYLAYRLEKRAGGPSEEEES